MNKTQFLFVGFLFYGLMQQSVFSSFRPISLHHNDKDECKLLRREIFAILHQEHYLPQNVQLPAEKYHYVNASIAMFKALKCNRFENNF